ncbi:hypothetical protein NPIL_692861, partial [Nephila pilipes]
MKIEGSCYADSRHCGSIHDIFQCFRVSILRRCSVQCCQRNPLPTTLLIIILQTNFLLICIVLPTIQRDVEPASGFLNFQPPNVAGDPMFY